MRWARCWPIGSKANVIVSLCFGVRDFNEFRSGQGPVISVGSDGYVYNLRCIPSKCREV